jgi:hypothetical protein
VSRIVSKIKGDYTNEEVSIAVKEANRRSYWSLIFFPAMIFFASKAKKLEKERMKQNESGKV